MTDSRLSSFTVSHAAEPHRDRTKAILKRHPAIREHIGKNPYSALAVLGLVAAQIALAAWASTQPWWLILLLAYTAGATADHALFVMVHECAHNLIFRRKIWNTLVAIVANVPSLLPSAVSFQRYHLLHHSHQGEYDLDADLPRVWEARLVGNSALGKALWLLFFPIAQTVRVTRMSRIPPIDRWVLLNIAVVLATDALLFLWLGPWAVLYLAASLFFSVGLHPLGARWIQRHFMVAAQETYSYYGPANVVAFNVGYHNEHHDFPSVPWNRLPRIKATAPEWYDGLVSHRSWTRLLLQFLFDREMSLFSRTVRPAEAGAAAEVRRTGTG